MTDTQKALEAFRKKYPTWWYKIGVCDLTRDFDCGPQAHSPEAQYIKFGNIWGNGFSCDHTGTVADAIYQVMLDIEEQAALVQQEADKDKIDAVISEYACMLMNAGYEEAGNYMLDNEPDGAVYQEAMHEIASPKDGIESWNGYGDKIVIEKEKFEALVTLANSAARRIKQYNTSGGQPEDIDEATNNIVTIKFYLNKLKNKDKNTPSRLSEKHNLESPNEQADRGDDHGGGFELTHYTDGSPSREWEEHGVGASLLMERTEYNGEKVVILAEWYHDEIMAALEKMTKTEE